MHSMTPTVKKAAAGTATIAVLSFLLYANEQRAKEHADLRVLVESIKSRQEFFHALPTLDEIKAQAVKE